MDNPSGSGVTKKISLSQLSNAIGGGDGISNIVEDSTPQLGGNLDLNNSNITGTGNININGNITSASGSLSRLSFNTSVNDPVLTQGQLSWDSTEGTLNLGITNTHAQHIGEELHYRVRNNTASTLLKGTAVYASGLTAGGSSRIEVLPFVADGSVREVRFMGLVTEDISTGINGYTTHYGHIHSLDTRGDATANGTTNKIWATGEPTWAAGDILYAHPTVAGKLTKIEPQHSISVAIILNRHQTQGKLFVRTTSFGHLEDNHDVAVSGATNGQFLQYNSASNLWVPSSSGNFTSLQISGVNVSVSGHSHTSSNITDFNSSVSGLLPSGLVRSNTSGIIGASGINNVVQINQADYNALVSKDPNTVYFVV
jgi:hypothetical protein